MSTSSSAPPSPVASRTRGQLAQDPVKPAAFTALAQRGNALGVLVAPRPPRAPKRPGEKIQVTVNFRRPPKRQNFCTDGVIAALQTLFGNGALPTMITEMAVAIREAEVGRAEFAVVAKRLEAQFPEAMPLLEKLLAEREAGGEGDAPDDDVGGEPGEGGPGEGVQGEVGQDEGEPGEEGPGERDQGEGGPGEGPEEEGPGEGGPGVGIDDFDVPQMPNNVETSGATVQDNASIQNTQLIEEEEEETTDPVSKSGRADSDARIFLIREVGDK